MKLPAASSGECNPERLKDERHLRFSVTSRGAFFPISLYIACKALQCTTGRSFPQWLPVFKR